MFCLCISSLVQIETPINVNVWRFVKLIIVMKKFNKRERERERERDRERVGDNDEEKEERVRRTQNSAVYIVI
jgi:hypothetical protein